MSKPYQSVIIDDEPIARERLTRLLLEFPEVFKVIDTAGNGIEALEKIQKYQPDLIFLDIEMPGLNGFEVLEQLEKIPLVIFCTAYDQYSLQAFETLSLDYLLKPVRKERLEKTISKLKHVSQNLSQASIKTLFAEFNKAEKQEPITSLTIREADRIQFIKLEDIIYFESSDKYVNVHTHAKKHLYDQSLNYLEKQLPSNFVRIQRGLILNKDYILEVHKYFNSRYAFKMKDNKSTQLNSGRSYKEELDRWLKS
ncbi:LytR/AlgR family response regulator transcription factor [Leeuwenhoekiella sp. H156]|uniref:LytR/AlgR family response regulator transcription factor n=1 Tax=Leeuwenhoekiella sp. H156 TaxID=3450128 RepID=UPI003FA4AB7C